MGKKPETRLTLTEAISKGKDSSSIAALFKASILSATDEVPKPEPVFGVADPRHGDVHVGTKGNISLFKGSKKTRKTFAISAVAAAVVGDKQIIQFKSMLGKKGMLLYVDTEQGKYDCKKVLHRELEMSGLDIKEFEKHLVFLTLRAHSPGTRREIIAFAIDHLKDQLDMVIIDGIRDLIVDINDSGESNSMVTDLMAWTGNYNIHILAVLHENKSNNSSRGHIGTELDNKSESIVRVSKYEADDTLSAIESEAMRGHSFDPYLFMIDDKGIPIMADGVEYEEPKAKAKGQNQSKPGPKGFDYDDIEQNEHAEIIRLSFIDEKGLFDDSSPVSARAFHTKIKASFHNKGHKIGDHRAREFTDKYLVSGLLKDLNADKEGNNSKKLVPGFDDDMPF